MIAELESQKQALEALITRLQGAVEALEAMSPETISLVEGSAQKAGSFGTRPEGGDVQQGTHFDRIANFLASRQNKGQPIGIIEKATGISRASISAVLYRTHRERFIAFDSPLDSRVKLWKLRDGRDPPAPTSPEHVGQEEEVPF